MELMPSAMSRATVVVYESETVTALHLLSSGSWSTAIVLPYALIAF